MKILQKIWDALFPRVELLAWEEVDDLDVILTLRINGVVANVRGYLLWHYEDTGELVSTPIGAKCEMYKRKIGWGHMSHLRVDAKRRLTE